MVASDDLQEKDACQSVQDESVLEPPGGSWMKELDEVYQTAEAVKMDKFLDPADAVKQMEALTTKLDTLAAAHLENQTMTEEDRHKWVEVASFLKGIAMESIENILSRGQNVESLVDKSEELRNEAEQYRQPKLLKCLCLSSIWDLIKQMIS